MKFQNSTVTVTQLLFEKRLSKIVMTNFEDGKDPQYMVLKLCQLRINSTRVAYSVITKSFLYVHIDDVSNEDDSSYSCFLQVHMSDDEQARN